MGRFVGTWLTVFLRVQTDSNETAAEVIDFFEKGWEAVVAVHLVDVLFRCGERDAHGRHIQWILAIPAQEFTFGRCLMKKSFGDTDDGGCVADGLIQMHSQPRLSLIPQRHISIHNNCRERHSHIVKQRHNAREFPLVKLARFVWGDGCDRFDESVGDTVRLPIWEEDTGRYGRIGSVMDINCEDHHSLEFIGNCFLSLTPSRKATNFQENLATSRLCVSYFR